MVPNSFPEGILILLLNSEYLDAGEVPVSAKVWYHEYTLPYC